MLSEHFYDEPNIDDFLLNKPSLFINPISEISDSTCDDIVTDFMTFIMNHNKIQQELEFITSGLCTDSEVIIKTLINFDPSNRNHHVTRILNKYSDEILSCMTYMFGDPSKEDNNSVLNFQTILPKMNFQYIWNCGKKEIDDYGLKISFELNFIRYIDTNNLPFNELITSYTIPNLTYSSKHSFIGITKHAFFCLIKLTKK